MTDSHGLPCWYELSTTAPDGAQAFYGPLLGWTWTSADMAGMDYRLASIGGTMVAGMMKADTGQPTGWTIYFAVSSADDTAAKAASLGATVVVPPTDIPNTGRFSILIDPQGAGFGILQPLPMPDGSGGGAFDQQKTGHGNWHELMTSDPKAAQTFYATLFGFTATRSMDMGAMGSYDIFAHNGTDIGGMMGQPPNVPRPMWLPYFGTDSAAAAAATITAHKGNIIHGPAEVPGGAMIVTATDPQGVMFAVVGPA